LPPPPPPTASAFVRERIDTMRPQEITEEILSTIISDDPRASQGIGGDNMTIIIIDFKPGERSYSAEEEELASEGGGWSDAGKGEVAEGS
ncbi:hypothetical protein TeGR_g12667, partial [Tetraparma gracilis]